ncbi:MAG: helix-turn-helix domain-containing protein [Anaerolineae bacterium]
MNRIRELREASGISGRKLARMIGISPQHLNELEKGRKRLNETLIVKLCRVFNVSSDYLLGINTEETGKGGNNLMLPGGHKFAELSLESRKILLQLIDRWYDLEMKQKSESEQAT